MSASWLSPSVTALLLCGCHLITGSYEVADAPPPGVGGAGGVGGTGAAGSSAGGQGGALDDSGLLVRYYLDEAAMGQRPLEVMDYSAPPLLPLALSYSGPELHYVEEEGDRGLAWDVLADAGKAETPIDGSKVYTGLLGSTQATIELIFRAQQLDVNFSRVMAIASATEGGLTLYTSALNELRFGWQPAGTEAGEWTIAILDRNVLHVVLDTNDADAPRRVRLYRNGVELTNTAATALLPGRGQTIQFGVGVKLTLGNREQADRSMVGVLYYAAIYNEAFTPQRIDEHVAILRASDDSP